jgi:hypothetical protein
LCLVVPGWIGCAFLLAMDFSFITKKIKMERLKFLFFIRDLNFQKGAPLRVAPTEKMYEALST